MLLVSKEYSWAVFTISEPFFLPLKLNIPAPLFQSLRRNPADWMTLDGKGLFRIFQNQKLRLREGV